MAMTANNNDNKNIQRAQDDVQRTHPPHYTTTNLKHWRVGDSGDRSRLHDRMAQHGGGISASTPPLGRRGCDDDNNNDDNNAHSPPLHNNQPEMLATMKTHPPLWRGGEEVAGEFWWRLS